MIGDRLDTDILFGKNGGLTTLLVMTGTQKLPLQLSHFPHNSLGCRSHQRIRYNGPQRLIYRSGLRDELDRGFAAGIVLTGYPSSFRWCEATEHRIMPVGLRIELRRRNSCGVNGSIYPGLTLIQNDLSLLATVSRTK